MLNYIRNYVESFTVVKIIHNSSSVVWKRPEPVMLGRWKVHSCPDLKIMYANMDHCGDHICGSPKILKETYPKQFKF